MANCQVKPFGCYEKSFPSLFKFDDSCISFKENSVERQETITLSSQVVIIGCGFFCLKKGCVYGELFCSYGNILLDGTCSPSVAPVYSGCCCVFKFANQVQLLRLPHCYFFWFSVSILQTFFYKPFALGFTWWIFYMLLMTFSVKLFNKSWHALSFVNQDPKCLIVNNCC